MEEFLLYYSLKYNGNFDKIFEALTYKETIDENLKKELFENFYTNSDAKFSTIISSDYPAKLKEISCPPFVIFYHGDLSLIDKKSVAIVGSIKPSEYGKMCTELYTSELAKKDNVIITGMQKGVATIALEQATKINKEVIAVLPCGIDTKQNNELYEAVYKNGLVLSEYPNNLEVKNDQITKSLRLISGISNTVLLTESETKSKQHAIVGFALEQGKNVCVIPSSIVDKDLQGNNNLIQMGAYLVTSPEDINNEISRVDYDDIEIEL